MKKTENIKKNGNTKKTASAKKTGAEIIIQLLEEEGISVVAGIPGGSILPLYDALLKSSIKHVLVRHEQAAGFFAQGIARTTGKTAVCFATSGPGAMNLLTALADARSDSVPLVAITGQVNSSLIGTDAFQEADTFGLSFPITKHSILVKSAEELFFAIPNAFQIAKSGRPGPVLIDVPRNVQLEKIEMDSLNQKLINQKKKNIPIKFYTEKKEYENSLDKILTLLASSKKPVLFCGGGCNSPKNYKYLLELLSLCDIPVVTSLMGIGCVSTGSKNYFGMLGMHGHYVANYALNKADLVIALGTRFDDRAVGKENDFCPCAKIVHVDLDAAEINKIFDADVSIVRSTEEVLHDIILLLKNQSKKINKGAYAAWNAELTKIKDEHSLSTMLKNSLVQEVESSAGSTDYRVLPWSLISALPRFAEKAGIKKENIIVTTDVGQHQMWAAQFYPVENSRTFITSGSLGTMGFGLPVAIGASYANKGKHVICISGDGSILMNIQELSTLAELNLPVTIIVFENKTLGMVYQQQKYLFKKNYSASMFEKTPDIVLLARAFGIDSCDISEDEKWYKRAFAKRKPFLLRVQISKENDVLPFVLPNTANVDAILPDLQKVQALK